MPGERLVVQGGDLYAGDQIIRKTPDQWHDVRLLVHDNDYQPVKTAGFRQRWRPIESASGWKPTGGGFRIEPSIADRSRFDWLEYEHWACTANEQARGVAAPITDNDPYNQGETRRRQSGQRRDDYLPTADMGSRAARASRHRWRSAVRDSKLSRAGGLSLDSAGQTLVERPLTTEFSRHAVDLEFGLLDQQVLLLADGRTLLRFEYERLPQARAGPLHPLAIGSRGIGLQVEQLRVWRDVYYLDAQGLARRWQMASSLGTGEFAVLGDNQPVSIDSRHWGQGSLSSRLIMGRVNRPFWASQ